MPSPSISGRRQRTSRRTFLRGVGAAGLSLALPRYASQSALGANRLAEQFPDRPNLLIILTDQERAPMHWPADWAATNLPNRKRIDDHGLVFRRAFCNTAMCSPSRSTLFTGLFPSQHGVKHTLTSGGTLSPTEPTLPLTVQNMAHMLASAGYNVHYRGKWHMSKGADGGEPTTADVAAYGFQGWQPPEAGENTDPDGFGGGCANWDQHYADQAVSFLQNVDVDSGTPFALIVSFVNPHDVLAYPLTWNQPSSEDPSCFNYLNEAPDCFNQGIGLPGTFDERLLQNYKPTAQAQFLALAAGGLGPLAGPLDPERYVNFYAYLQKVVDQHIGAVLDALEARPGLVEKTLIIRASDHGEMGLSHGGMRQKSFNVYEETMRVPLVFSNPLLFPQTVYTDALASLVDLMPTLASLVDVPNRDSYTFAGQDLSPIINDAVANPDNPTATVQDSILFTFDDENVGAPNGQTVVTQPNHIRCIREARWKFAHYFDPSGQEPSQYELYDLANDPDELHNMADPANGDYYDPDKVAEMAGKLAAKAAAVGALPYQAFMPVINR
ncbi:sulfatase-like hydrolase/transferase [Litorilinea aerophila]|uniref:Sulfatase-like hydrolase/transferase n=1 Tax=Litorilinea aerophila TaxID=1204385 RepID=A0A540VJI0_9CHLR|nr:sulfatase-like hydrolase/transferase [Litorilinea aerophila]MCC9075403.1 sulfatase-like hydrolase/transferase [Litorilinea aerophila]